MVQTLWFSGAQDVDRYKFEATHLMDLARGLRAGAMQDVMIEERLYRSFIISFCLSSGERGQPLNGVVQSSMDTEADDHQPHCSDALRRMIQSAFRAAVLTTAPLPPSHNTTYLAKPESGPSLLAKAQKRYNQLLIDTIDKELEEKRNEFGIASTPASSRKVTDIDSMVLDVCNCSDIDTKRAGIEEILQIIFKRAFAPVEEIRDMLLAHSHRLSETGKKLQSGNGDLSGKSDKN
jgi:hypothetical protein